MKQTASIVTEKAIDYARKAGYEFVRIENVSSNTEEKKWVVTMNIGIIKDVLKEVIIDDNTGDVISFRTV